MKGNKHKHMLWLLFGFVSILLAGCGGDPDQTIHEHMEKSVEIESNAAKDQNAIVTAEKQEKQIYEELIGQGDNQLDKIQKLSDKATKNIKKRAALIKKEKESMDESKENFAEIKGQIEKLKTDKEKQKANKMYQSMQKRFSLYASLYKAYNHSLSEENKMYKLLAKKDAKHESVVKQIEKVNASYEKLIDENKAFNDQTATYNQLKKDFYKTTDLDVEYTDQQKK